MTTRDDESPGATLALCEDLIARPSVCPDDAGCQALIAARLAALGFSIERLAFGAVENLWARHGTESPLFCFAGHTDVVPAGPLSAWHSDPFVPEIRAGRLYGRGAADMKGGLAAMVTAAERFLAIRPEPRGSLAFLLTSDEEGPAVDGTRRVMEALVARGERIDWCLIGEPTSEEILGDAVKVGRRGSLSATLRILGIQGHVAYPERVENPIHLGVPALQALCATRWDEGNDSFPPTSFQITDVRAGVGADNVVPGELTVRFNLRYSTASNHRDLKDRIAEILARHGVRFECDWRLAAEPFLSSPGRLRTAVQAAISAVQGAPPRASTSGGTSDGRFIAPLGIEVVELGPINRTIHQVNEQVGVDDLEALSTIYERVLGSLLIDEIDAGRSRLPP